MGRNRNDGCQRTISRHQPSFSWNGNITIIGGAEIFELFEPYATRIELTEVHEDTAGDVFMAAPGPEWREVAREEHPAAGKDPAYAFVTWERAA